MFLKREKLFVSYASDNDSFVRDEVLPQVKRGRRDPWFAPKNMDGGVNWRMELLDGLETCDRLLVVVSRESQASDYVRDEVAHAARRLLEKRARLDARRVHRAILPVKLDPRDEFGQTPEDRDLREGNPQADVNPYQIHPYLTLVNYIEMPHSAALNKKLDPETGRYLHDPGELTRAQRESIREYVEQRTEARERLLKAIRNPDVLHWGFKRFGRMLATFASPTFQRFALAFGVVVAIFALLQLPTSLFWSDEVVDVARAPSLRITANGTTLPVDRVAAAQGIPLDLRDGPMNLLIEARTRDGEPARASITFRPDAEALAAAQPHVPPADDGATSDVTEVEPAATLDQPTYEATAPTIEYRLERSGAWKQLAEGAGIPVGPGDTPLYIRSSAGGDPTSTHAILQPEPSAQAPTKSDPAQDPRKSTETHSTETPTLPDVRIVFETTPKTALVDSESGLRIDVGAQIQLMARAETMDGTVLERAAVTLNPLAPSIEFIKMTQGDDGKWDEEPLVGADEQALRSGRPIPTLSVEADDVTRLGMRVTDGAGKLTARYVTLDAVPPPLSDTEIKVQFLVPLLDGFPRTQKVKTVDGSVEWSKIPDVAFPIGADDPVLQVVARAPGGKWATRRVRIRPPGVTKTLPPIETDRVVEAPPAVPAPVIKIYKAVQRERAPEWIDVWGSFDRPATALSLNRFDISRYILNPERMRFRLTIRTGQVLNLRRPMVFEMLDEHGLTACATLVPVIVPVTVTVPVPVPVPGDDGGLEHGDLFFDDG